MGEPALHVGAGQRRFVRAEAEQLRGRDLAVDGWHDISGAIDGLGTAGEAGSGGGIDAIGFGQHDAVGDGDLLVGFEMFVKLGEAVLGVDGGDDAVEHVDAVDALIRHHGVHDRGRIGEAGGFEDDALYRRNFAAEHAIMQAGERLDEIAAHGATDAARGEEDGVLVDFLDQGVVETDIAEFVDDDRGSGHIRMRQESLQQRGFARAEEACEDGQGNGGGHVNLMAWRASMG